MTKWSNQWINQSRKWMINQAINKINQSINQSMTKWSNQSINQSRKWMINQAINDSINQSINQSIECFSKIKSNSIWAAVILINIFFSQIKRLTMEMQQIYDQKEDVLAAIGFLELNGIACLDIVRDGRVCYTTPDVLVKRQSDIIFADPEAVVSVQYKNPPKNDWLDDILIVNFLEKIFQKKIFLKNFFFFFKIQFLTCCLSSFSLHFCLARVLREGQHHFPISARNRAGDLRRLRLSHLLWPQAVHDCCRLPRLSAFLLQSMR